MLRVQPEGPSALARVPLRLLLSCIGVLGKGLHKLAEVGEGLAHLEYLCLHGLATIISLSSASLPALSLAAYELAQIARGLDSVCLGSAALGPGQLLQAVRNVRDWRDWTGLLVGAGSASRAAHVSLVSSDVFPARGAEFSGLAEAALLFLKCSLICAARAADPIGDRQTSVHA